MLFISDQLSGEDHMSFYEYLKKEIEYIQWFSRHHGISIEDACNQWVKQGLAELFAQKYRNITHN